MLKGQKVSSSLACKLEFYRPEHNAKGDPNQILQFLKRKNEIYQKDL